MSGPQGGWDENRIAGKEEISLRELASQLRDLRDLMQTKFEAQEKVRQETNQRYEQRFSSAETAVAAALAAQEKAVAAALSAQKEATAAAFAASEKAIVKAESAQTDFNERNNQLRGALDDSTRDKLSRGEADARFKAMEGRIEDMKLAVEKGDRENRDSIANLRESRSTGEGRSLGTAAVVAYIISAISIVGALIGIFIALSG